MALVSAARSVPATCSERPNTAAASTPGKWRKARAASSMSAPLASKVMRPDWRGTLSPPRPEDPALGEKGDALPAPPLVHVRGRPQPGQPLARHIVDKVPEFATRQR